ncbi:uncharacterized protein YndB with AHSA1/START domain [Clostridium acetobutylicum]|uniref:Activator of Hsp90 ATPase homologue 1/2-like C-terminal domain-containing protein n=1 Tax=Clostridium acetobutylicum (strain ATCC 824 / DSM 792 / JCM 1419 / IAM 19013 / LMG 5710 / NBRC 13948 / NRRL B-527 / VKM B-1787 / 2291 / W) TaxID=272562 RepID=Q97HI6_CLOAB|nr:MULTISPECIES: SRPBCC domain-containing protein [Clostridium]AAK79984.1 Hypothetical protein CA_C2025 [Clostridium acetobutylicum ATCC 824]ADZ21076.1 Conserved hypothetical protein [Clostridium acetobutylicum EA 2018]AEI32132.1 hypothetical protein SMB_G2057 [Clostridium acetobutylicum DSM 1731]AWV79586.1 hypothetical protein DK921_05620 [Clostridium acetobutylicum]MBC2394441.1 hypothetical protein [Clostridium acetobutylicum]
MVYAKASALIEKQIEQVYEFVLNGENLKLWKHNIYNVKNTSGEPVDVGTVFSQEIRIPTGRIINADFKIIECEKNKKVAFEVLKGPYKPIGIYSLESIDNKTRVTFTMQEEVEMNEKTKAHIENVVNTIHGLKLYLEANK